MINKALGFTLIEVLMVVTIAAILLVVAVPSFYVIVGKNNAMLYSDEFVMALNLARSEAIQRNTPISVCPISAIGLPSCNSNNWGQGWVVFVDVNASGTLQNNSDKLLIHDLLDKVMVSTNTGRITFSDTGEIISGDGNMFFRGNSCYGKNAREVFISKIGKIRQQYALCQ